MISLIYTIIPILYHCWNYFVPATDTGVTRYEAIKIAAARATARLISATLRPVEQLLSNACIGSATAIALRRQLMSWLLNMCDQCNVRLYFSVLVLFVTNCAVRGFNVDTENFVKYSGEPGSMFGFSVAEHKERGSNWWVFLTNFTLVIATVFPWLFPTWMLVKISDHHNRQYIESFHAFSTLY